MLKKSKSKSWWRNHWDEVILVGGILIGLYITFKSMGII